MKYSILKALLLSGFCIFHFTNGTLIDESKLKEGDLIFQQTRSRQAKALQLATKSRYTHVGLVFKYHGRWKVFEAVQPVKITPLKIFLKRGVNHHYVVKRHKNADKLLTPQKIKAMKKYGRRFMGKNYDIAFNWSDNRIYCTELAWKLYDRVLNVQLAPLEKMKDFDLSHPLVKKVMRKRYGKYPPLNQPVISVSGMFKGSDLVTVMSKN